MYIIVLDRGLVLMWNASMVSLKTLSVQTVCSRASNATISATRNIQG
jgi:hypothetical protein